MVTQWSHVKKGSLPYGMILTRIFLQYKVELADEPFESLLPSHRYSVSSIQSILKYKWDSRVGMYYMAVGRHQIRYYTRDSPDLPAGYEGPPEYVPLYADGVLLPADRIPADIPPPPPAADDPDLPPPTDDPLAFDPDVLREPMVTDLPSFSAPPPPSASDIPPGSSSSAPPPTDIMGYLERLSLQMSSMQTSFDSRFSSYEQSFSAYQQTMDARYTALQDSVDEIRDEFIILRADYGLVPPPPPQPPGPGA